MAEQPTVTLFDCGGGLVFNAALLLATLLSVRDTEDGGALLTFAGGAPACVLDRTQAATFRAGLGLSKVQPAGAFGLTGGRGR